MAGLSYASIALGACITAAVLVLSIPSAERVERWVQTSSPGSEFSHFSDLVFVFTWSAVAQLLVIGVSLGAYLFGGDVLMAPAHPRWTHIVALAVTLTITLYAFWQLMTVIATLSQVAYVTISETQPTSRHSSGDPAT